MSAHERTNEARAALAYAQAWRQRAEVLDAERLHALRALSEADAAQLFIRVLQGNSVAPARPSSGLIEQQRIFDRLRETRG